MAGTVADCIHIRLNASSSGPTLHHVSMRQQTQHTRPQSSTLSVTSIYISLYLKPQDNDSAPIYNIDHSRVTPNSSSHNRCHVPPAISIKHVLKLKKPPLLTTPLPYNAPQRLGSADPRARPPPHLKPRTRQRYHKLKNAQSQFHTLHMPTQSKL
jgi:hypothetical protein